ncbi:hypothetical protein GGS23DRAFT_117106 [Durotheca rogersii]|uniref:uncharacterized protein n=1 Tax=Durotheca rogersii TaxID=419775 RepID=UPI00221EDAC7|nr:uncharacterized protein GGS23DRAFT_117106 [Durotheca rogersii]KAI5861882.1 hypothetical protein GGS23DRAFT_117106 [Durotheca rogersii]
MWSSPESHGLVVRISLLFCPLGAPLRNPSLGLGYSSDGTWKAMATIAECRYECAYGIHRIPRRRIPRHTRSPTSRPAILFRSSLPYLGWRATGPVPPSLLRAEVQLLNPLGQSAKSWHVLRLLGPQPYNEGGHNAYRLVVVLLLENPCLGVSSSIMSGE